MRPPSISIGGASGFWGDSAIALPQLLDHQDLDYITFDYLAEITMSILARARAKDPAQGYVGDFVSLVARYLPQIADRRVKLIANAGGVNPTACAEALRLRIREAGLTLKVGVVTGDDLLPLQDQLSDRTEMFSGEPMPRRLLSLNAYLGAAPIAAALAAEADIVVTGRCVDSAMALGACIHEFGWSMEDYDRLSAGSLAGHIIECGAQATGGLFTDWELTGDWANIGYPIAVIEPDGAFEVTKPEGTGGLVSRGTVSEQLLYEIGDPGAYLLPDVACDWRQVTITEVGPDRVRVEGAQGYAPTDTYKASATWADGFRVGALWTIIGDRAPAKARKVADAVLRRTAGLLDAAGHAPFTETSVEVLGAETSYGAHGRADAAREVILKIAAKHPEPAPLDLLVREFTSAGTSMAPGFTGLGGNRPKVMPVIRLFSVLVPRSLADQQVAVTVNGEKIPLSPPSPAPLSARSAPSDSADAPRRHPSDTTVPLIKLAWGRSGDKGNHANIGIIARKPEWLAYIREALTCEVVAGHFAHYGPPAVRRYDLPGAHALNFMLLDVLGGGGIASLRNDPQGKGYAQILLDAVVLVPSDIAASLS